MRCIHKARNVLLRFLRSRYAYCAERSTAEVREILQALSELPVLIEKSDDLDRRIRSMSDDKARFLAAVQVLAHTQPDGRILNH